MKNLLLTISIGDRPWFKEIKFFMVLYCKKYNLDFKVLDGNFTSDIDSRLKKLEIKNFFKDYDRILYLDDTCIISPECPNLFDIVPYDKIGVVLEKLPYYNKFNTLKESLMHYNQDCKNISEQNHVWFNSGVILASKIHISLFEFPQNNIKRIGHFIDQPIFNSNRYKYNLNFVDLGLRYNYLGTRIGEEIPYKITDLDNIYIYHLTRAWTSRKRKRKINEIINILKKNFNL